jgi:hypothetical protein
MALGAYDSEIFAALTNSAMACVISTVSHSHEAIAAAALRTWIMNEQPPTAVPSTHFGVMPR